MSNNKNARDSFKIDHLFHGLIGIYLNEIVLGVILFIAFLIRRHLAPVCVLSPDYNQFIVPWFEHYKLLGIVRGLAEGVGDYYIPYNLFLAVSAQLPVKPYTAVAFTSGLADFISALFLYRTVNYIKPCTTENGRRKLTCAALLLLPFVVLNSALWKQCDSIYTCFVIGGLYFAFRKKYTSAFLMFSLGFCFKLQAIFILPFLIILYMAGEEFSVLEFLWYPIMYLVTGLPAIFCGRPWKQVYKIYLAQSEHYDAMSIHSMNIYCLGLTDYPALSRPAIMATIGIFALAAAYFYRWRKSLDKTAIFYIAIWSTWTCYYFLPAMHERYDYLPILMITAFALLLHKQILWIAIALNAISISTYTSALMGEYFSAPDSTLLAAIYLVCYFALSWDLHNMIKTTKD